MGRYGGWNKENIQSRIQSKKLGGGVKSYILICSDTFYSLVLTAKTLYRKFDTNIPRNETAQPCVPNSYICVLVSDIYVYSYDRSAYSAAGK